MDLRHIRPSHWDASAMTRGLDNPNSMINIGSNIKRNNYFVLRECPHVGKGGKYHAEKFITQRSADK